MKLDRLPSGCYRLSVKAIIRNTQGHILLAQNPQGYWIFPGGGIEHGEDIREALERELVEEIGYEAIEIADTPLHTTTRHVKDKKKGNHWKAYLFYGVEIASEQTNTSCEYKNTKYCDPFLDEKEGYSKSVREYLKVAGRQ